MIARRETMPPEDALNESILKHFSPSAQNFIRACADTPEKAVALYNGLTSFRGALRIGNEIIEKGASPQSQGQRDAITSTLATNLAVCSAIECFMSLLQDLHKDYVGALKAGPPPGDSTAPTKDEHDHIIERFKGLD